MSRLGLGIVALWALLLAAPPAGAHSDSGAFAGGHGDSESGSHAHDAQVELDPSLISSVAPADAPPGHSVSMFGHLVPSETALRDVNAYLSGQIVKVFVRRGMHVEEGDLVASIYSPEFILTQRAYLALLTNDLLRATLDEEGRLPDFMRDARSNLHWWGMDENDIAALESRKEPVEQLEVRAPAAGVVTEVFVQPGQLIAAGDRTMQNFIVVGTPVARIALDDGETWIQALAHPDEIGEVIPWETRARVHIPGHEPLEAPVIELRPSVEADTRRAQLLLDFGVERHGLAFGQRVRVELLQQGEAGLWIPREAVLGQGVAPRVFVEAAPGRYLRRAVDVQQSAGDWLQVHGLDSAERVVMRGKMLLEGAHRLGGHAHADAHHHH